MTYPQRSVFLFLALFAVAGGCECGGGGVTTGDRPDPPVLDPFETSLLKCIEDGCSDTIQFSGIKQSSTAIHSNGAEVVVLNERTDFSFEVELVEGENKFEIEAVDNGGGRSTKVIATIQLVRRPEPPEVNACVGGFADGECRDPDNSSLLIHAEETIDWAGTRPEGSGIRMVITVDGVVQRDETVVPPGPGTDWSIEDVALAETEDGFTNVNTFEFFSWQTESVQSAPTTVQVDYDTSGCTMRFAEHEVVDGAEFSEVNGCLIEVNGEERPGFCAWTSKTLEEGDPVVKKGAYALEGRSCEGSAVILKQDGGEEQQIKEPSAEVSWSHSVERPWADTSTPNEGEHILEVWARLDNGRESTHQFAKVVFDFTPPSVGEITVRDQDNEVIEGSNTNSGTVQVCGDTEPGAQVQISNSDADGEPIGTCEGLAQDDGAYCVSCDLAEGQNQLYVTVIDRARNSSAMNEDEASRGRSRLLNVDSAGPDVTFISPRANAYVDPGEVDVRVQVVDNFNGVASVTGGVGEAEGVEFPELQVEGESDIYGGTVTIPDQGDQFVLWVEATDNVGNVSRTTVNLSKTGASVQITSEEAALNSLSPRIAVGPNGHMYAVWQHCQSENECGDTRIYAATVDEGGSWGEPIVITYLTGSAPNGAIDGLRTALSREPDVAVDADGVAHIVWSDAGTGREGVGGAPVWSGAMRDGIPDIVYRTWDGSAGAEGLSVVEVVSVGDDMGDAPMETPRIAVGESGPAVVFTGYVDALDVNPRESEVFYSTRAQDGWSAVMISPRDLNSSPLGEIDAGALFPVIAIDKDDVRHVAWIDDGNVDGDSDPDVDVYYRIVGGAADQEGVRYANGNCSGGTFAPSIAVDMEDLNNRVYVAYQAFGDCADAAAQDVGGVSVRFAWHEGDAPQFTLPVTVNDEAIFVEEEVNRNGEPSIKVHAVPDRPVGEHVVVVAFQSKASLQSSGNDYDIMLRRFDRDDAPLAQGYVVLSEPTIDEDNTTTNSRYPSIALDASGAAHVLWEQSDDSDAPDNDIFYAVSAP